MGFVTMKKIIQNISNTFLNKRLGLRVQLFNIMAIVGTLVSLFATVTSVAIGDSIAEWGLYLLFTLLAAGLLWFATKTGHYKLCYGVTIVAIFLVGFPLFFLTGGAYYGSIPYFFVFAIVFTVFMLEGKAAVMLALLEMAVYTGLCLYTYFFVEIDPSHLNEGYIAFEAVFGFLVVGIALGAAMFFQIRLYNEQQKELARRNDELDQSDKRKTEFLSNISHELRTPLTVVSSHVQLSRRALAERPDTEDLQNTMKLVGSEIDRMALMVSQMLDISRIDEERMSIELRPEDIAEMMQSTLETYYPVFGKNRNKLVFRRESEIPNILCDHLRIKQVLVNLISNAARHTYGGEITVSVKTDNDMAVITVADTGEGIAAERIPHLFDRYYSAAAKAQRTGEKEAQTGWDTGMGLGLFICKHIVDAHGGSIWIESALSEGTAVSFTLPLTPLE